MVTAIVYVLEVTFVQNPAYRYEFLEERNAHLVWVFLVVCALCSYIIELSLEKDLASARTSVCILGISMR